MLTWEKDQMKHALAALLLLSKAFTPAAGQEYTSVTDPRDGRQYRTVRIGTQAWMADNLSAGSFLNGDPIPQARTAAEWVAANEKGEPVWCHYEFQSGNESTLGRLYNGYAVADRRGLAPAGWHLPSMKEWRTLWDQSGGEYKAGQHLKSTQGWDRDGNGDNASGFDARPTGFAFSGFFGFRGSHGFWWSSEAADKENGQVVQLVFSDAVVRTYPFPMKNGYAVRCLRD